MSLKEKIIGNGRIVEILEKNFNSGKIAHAYLFEGPGHIGKKTLALHFCRLLLEDQKENIQDNADFMSVYPDKEKKLITVEEIREIEKKLSLYPHSSKYKIVLMDEAEKMSKSAANALLKTLEEPNKSSVIILITSKSKDLPDTIKSRCQVFNFLPVKKELLEKFLEGKIVDRDKRERVMELAGYKPGKIIEFLNDNDKFERAKKCIDKLSDIFGKTESERLDEAEEVSREEIKEIIGMLDIWVIHLRNLLIKRYREDDRIDEAGTAGIAELRNKICLINMIKENLLTKNINVRLAIENLFISI